MRHRLRVLNTKTSKQMNNIYQESVQAVKDGAKFRVDLERRNLTIDGKKIITNGELWMKKCEEDINVYWLCRKMANKLRGTL